jgi:putative Holliday junction resolvase
MGRVLCIDYGKRRHGLALSDGLRLTGRPYGSIERPPSRAEEFGRLRDIIEKEEVDLLVMGLPFNMDGTPGTHAPEVLSYAKALTKFMGLDVFLQDERLTTVEAERLLRETGRGPRRGRERGDVDAVAAAIILREFLEVLAKGGVPSDSMEDAGEDSLGEEE